MGRSPGPTVPGRKRGRPPKNRALVPIIDSSSLTPSTTQVTIANSRHNHQQQENSSRNCIPQNRSDLSQSRSAIIAFRRNNAHYRKGNSDNTTVSESIEDSPPQYPRRFPRVSGYYQVGDLPPIPKDLKSDENDGTKRSSSTALAYSSERKRPILMSMDVPFRTENEIETNTIVHYDSVAGEDYPGPVFDFAPLTTLPTTSVETRTSTGYTSFAVDVPTFAECSDKDQRSSSTRRRRRTVSIPLPVAVTTTERMQILHRPHIASAYTTTEDDVDSNFITYAQLGNPATGDFGYNYSRDYDVDESGNPCGTTSTVRIAPTHFNPTVAYMEWMQNMRAWYSDMVVAQGFPVSQPGSRSTKSRYKKQRTTTNSLESRSGSNYDVNNSSNCIDNSSNNNNTEPSSSTTSSNHSCQTHLQIPLPLLPPSERQHGRQGNPRCHHHEADKDLRNRQQQTEYQQPSQPSYIPVATVNKKRKRSNADMSSCQTSSKHQMPFQGSMEALEYKLHSHDGNFQKAALACLVQWNHGQIGYSTLIRRQKRQQLHERSECRKKINISNNSNCYTYNNSKDGKATKNTGGTKVGKSLGGAKNDISWKADILQPIPLHGDFRQRRKLIGDGNDLDGTNRKELAYCDRYYDDADAVFPNSATVIVSHHHQQELNKTWKAVRACAVAVLEQLKKQQEQHQSLKSLEQNVSTCISSTKEKIYLSSLLHFLSQVARMPPATNTSSNRESNVGNCVNGKIDNSANSSPTMDEPRESLDRIMQNLFDECWKSRKAFAKLLDAWGTEDSNGVDIDSLRKELEKAEKDSVLVLDYAAEMHRQLDAAAEWQIVVDAIIKEQESSNDTVENICSIGSPNDDEATAGIDDVPRNDLATLECLYQRGKMIAEFRSKALVSLEAKVMKGQQLRERIVTWKRDAESNPGGKKETIKFVVAIVREINRTKLRFPEVVELLQFHLKAERWVDRASIAIRSRMSLAEIKSLIETGKREISPYVDLSEYMEKLESRVDMAEEWLISFHKIFAIVPTELSSSSRKLQPVIEAGTDDNKVDTSIVKDEGSEAYTDPETIRHSRQLSSLEKMKMIRTELDDKENNCLLHELASEGSRIPVDVECMKLLQLELDARGWSSKAKKWIPANVLSASSKCVNSNKGDAGIVDAETGAVSKRVGKLEDIRDHLLKAAAFRDRLHSLSSVSNYDSEQWVLEGEKELEELVRSADAWLQQHQEFLDIDGRCRNNFGANNDSDRYSSNSGSSIRVSLEELRKIVSEGNAIHVNMGNPMTKITRILTQAENWKKSYQSVLSRCNVLTETTSDMESSAQRSLVNIRELKSAIEAASSDVSVDLKEAIELEKILKRVQNWEHRASLGIPTSKSFDNKGNTGRKRKSIGKGPNNYIKTIPMAEYTVAELLGLIEEAKHLCVDLSDSLHRLQAQVDSVRGWQDLVAKDIENIVTGFNRLQESLVEAYGQPLDFVLEKGPSSSSYEVDIKSKNSSSSATNRDFIFDFDDDEEECDALRTITQENVCSSLPPRLDRDSDVHSSGDTRSGTPRNSTIECKNVHNLVKAFCVRSTSNCVITPERSIASQLSEVSKWCVRSVQILEKQHEVFDKRFFGAFDRFVLEGRELVKKENSQAGLPSIAGAQVTDVTYSVSKTDQLRFAWTGVINDQLERLCALASERKRFVAFCSKAENFLDEDSKKITMDKLSEYATKCDEFPSVGGIIRKIQKLYSSALQWLALARKTLDFSSSNEKSSFDNAKALLSDGDKLGIQCSELRTLRHGLKAAKGWSNRVKKLKLDDPSNCETNVKEVKALLDEHDNLIVEMPEEVVQLRQASKNYCLCRRPFEGFMIGCDTCDEWFHGPCIGVTESKADKVSKYVCVRCSLEKSFRSSCSTIVDVIRKWTCKKDMKKARRMENQKHQRKVRKETKDLERLRHEQTLLLKRLDERGIESQQLRQEATHQSLAFASLEIPVSQNFASMAALKPQCPVAEREETDRLPVASSEPPLSDSASVDADISNDPIVPDNWTRDEYAARLAEVRISIKRCLSKLEHLSQILIDRIRTESMETSSTEMLLKWCILVRSQALVPSRANGVENSRPPVDGTLSRGMITVLSTADRYGLSNIDDVKIVRNSFHCICWILRALTILRDQASVVDLKALLDQVTAIYLPDEKALRMLKGFYFRAVAWESKVKKVLAPIPGEAKPFNVDLLKELSVAGDDIPLCMSLESRLSTVIEDNGMRHCICGGPSDGRFMVACEECDRWYHGHCVKLSRHTSDDDLVGWRCPSCAGIPEGTIADLDLDKFHDFFYIENDETADALEQEGGAIGTRLSDPSTAERLIELWPPYGLLSTAKAMEALGEECILIPDSIADELLRIPTKQWKGSQRKNASIHKSGYQKSPSTGNTHAHTILSGIGTYKQLDLLKQSTTYNCVNGTEGMKASLPQPSVQAPCSGVVPSYACPGGDALNPSSYSDSQTTTIVSSTSGTRDVGCSQTSKFRSNVQHIPTPSNWDSVVVNVPLCTGSKSLMIPFDVSEGSLSSACLDGAAQLHDRNHKAEEPNLTPLHSVVNQSLDQCTLLTNDTFPSSRMEIVRRDDENKLNSMFPSDMVSNVAVSIDSTQLTPSLLQVNDPTSIAVGIANTATPNIEMSLTD